jgi:hypothetical protein
VGWQGLHLVLQDLPRPSLFPLIDRYALMASYPSPLHLVSHHHLTDGKDIIIPPIRSEDTEIELTHELQTPERVWRKFQC